jgi:hypothetical protein
MKSVTPILSHRMPANEVTEAYRGCISRGDHALEIILNPQSRT